MEIKPQVTQLVSNNPRSEISSTLRFILITLYLLEQRGHLILSKVSR